MRKKILVTLMMTALVMLSSCSIPGVTEPMDSKEGGKISGNKQNTNEDKDNIKNDDTDDKYHIPKDSPTYSIGDEVKYIHKENKFSEPELELTYTVNSAKVYDRARDSGIDESKFFQFEVYEEFIPNECHLKPAADCLDARLLVCDISIKYEDLYIEKFGNEDGITFLSLIYVFDDGSYSNVSMPCYVSNGKEAPHHFDFDIPESQAVNMQVGWVIDPKVLNVDELDISRLRIVTSSGGHEDFWTCVALGLSD